MWANIRENTLDRCLCWGFLAWPLAKRIDGFYELEQVVWTTDDGANLPSRATN
ncbi:hypothetical protein T190_30380 [Sinorhizobium meliloti CCBAU 01290]|nr:hypothetical protein T190_30380 [Sinorhizobium meliloti CCBAU 01290]